MARDGSDRQGLMSVADRTASSLYGNPDNLSQQALLGMFRDNMPQYGELQDWIRGGRMPPWLGMAAGNGNPPGGPGMGGGAGQQPPTQAPNWSFPQYTQSWLPPAPPAPPMYPTPPFRK